MPSVYSLRTTCRLSSFIVFKALVSLSACIKGLPSIGAAITNLGGYANVLVVSLLTVVNRYVTNTYIGW